MFESLLRLTPGPVDLTTVPPDATPGVEARGHVPGASFDVEEQRRRRADEAVIT